MNDAKITSIDIELATRPSAVNCPVTVVPIFAPKMIAVAWDSVMIFAPRKPMTITLTAPDDCNIAVEIVPIKTPSSFECEVVSNNLFIVLLLTLQNVSLIILQAYINTPMPESKMQTAYTIL